MNDKTHHDEIQRDDAQPSDDLHDRLIDRALRETLGGETPPDLSGSILAASKTQFAACKTQQVVPPETLTPSTGVVAMNEKPMRRKRVWLTLAVAASLFVMAGFLLPEFQTARESVRESAQTTEPANAVKATAGDWELSVPKGANEADKAEESRLREEFERLQTMSAEERFVLPREELGGPVLTPVPEAAFPNFSYSGDVASQRKENVKIKDANDDGVQVAAVPAQAKHDEVDKLASNAQARPAHKQESTFLGRAFRQGSFSLDQPTAPTTWGYGSQYSRTERLLLERTPGILFGDGERLGLPEQGRGPGQSGDKYARIHENPFVVAHGEDALSTFSIDVDTASYANVRQFLMQQRQLPPPDAVRIEELVNYFDYDYAPPTDDVPFASHVEVAACPWNAKHRLVRIGIKGREIDRQARPQSNLVFLVDVSGSMNEPAKLPLLVEGMKMLTKELGENDRVAIVVYASSEGVALASTRGDQQQAILSALEKLRAGGSTAGGRGIELAYKIAKENFIAGGVNRVILATDGDFNVGVTSTAELERLAETEAKETGVFLTVLGFGRGNLNDAMMEAISGKGNGNYYYVDNLTEAKKVLVEEMSGTLVTIAKDVKIQVEFNPARAAGYRLIGYENRMLAAEDFNDDKKDAGEIGAGHTVTALYEVVPAGQEVAAGKVDPLKYQQSESSEPEAENAPATASDELLTLKIRYKQPDGDKSAKLEFPIKDSDESFAAATPDFKFAAAVASFAMLLRDSQYRGETSYDAVLEIAQSSVGDDVHADDSHDDDSHQRRAEFLEVVRQAKQLAGE